MEEGWEGVGADLQVLSSRYADMAGSRRKDRETIACGTSGCEAGGLGCMRNEREEGFVDHDDAYHVLHSCRSSARP